MEKIEDIDLKSNEELPNLIRKVNQDISLCLVMIVKDEEDTIEKCLKSVAPYISHWVIVDTGSKDNTIDVINKVTKELNIPGTLYERPWVNFEVNRTESLELADGICEYRWIIDADDFFIPETKDGKSPFVGLDKSADAFQLLYKLNNIQYYRTQIVKSNQPWIYKGVLHEYLTLPDVDANHGKIQKCFVKADISPLKRANSLEEKYAGDAKILEEAFEKEPENARYAFYLAQSYRDSSQIDKSIIAYEKRASMGGWEEEVYYSYYMIAKLKETRNDNIDDVINAYSRAWEYRPHRLEALFHVMRKLRNEGRNILAFTYGLMGAKAPGCNDILFIEHEIWQWRFLDEFSLAAFHTGNPEAAYKYLKPVIESEFFENLNVQDKNRLNQNLLAFKENAGLKQAQMNK